MTKLNAARARQAITDHTQRLAEAAAAAGPDAPVPTTPGWTISNLVEHLGQTQNWVAEIIEKRVNDFTQFPTEYATLPEDPAEWQAWLSASAQRVTDACSDEAMTAPVLNAAGDERTGTEFWLSSSLNEAVIHGVDAALTAGHPTDIDADIAAVLITNHLAMLTSPTWEMQRAESAQAIRGTGQTLQWQATDTEAAWFVERRPEGATWHAGTKQADVTVTGSAQSLLLALTRRQPPTNLTITGDTALAHHWIENTAHIAD